MGCDDVNDFSRGISSSVSGSPQISPHDPMKGASVLVDYRENLDKGKLHVQEVLDDLFKRLSQCVQLEKQIKAYPMDQITSIDPLVECRNMEQALGRLERKLRMAFLSEQILHQKQQLQQTEEEMKRVNEAKFL